MNKQDIENRFEMYDRFLRTGNLIRGEWGNGIETACMLLAIAPEITAVGVIPNCPASLMPQWFAKLVPMFDDCGTEDKWLPMAKRFAKVGRNFHKITDAQWASLDFQCRKIFVEEASEYTEDSDVLTLCAESSSLLTKAAAETSISTEELAQMEKRASKAVLALHLTDSVTHDGNHKVRASMYVAYAVKYTSNTIYLHANSDAWRSTIQAAEYAAPTVNCADEFGRIACDRMTDKIFSLLEETTK